jgi:hypothetical protein
VSANLVTQFAIAWVHQHLGAIRPYLPDLSAPNATVSDWRPSALPAWSGPDDFNFSTFESVAGHRWLPVSTSSPLWHKTPMDESTYSIQDAPKWWHTWRVAAQQHYSFLENLEKGELWRYAFDMWDASYKRVSINLLAVSGDDIVAMRPFPTADEQFLTMDYPKKVGRREFLFFRADISRTEC